MKQLLLAAALVALAALAAQADDANPKASAPAESACCAKTKVSTQAAGSCPMAAGSCCSMEKKTAARKTMDKTVVKQVLRSPKAAAAL